MAEKRTWTVLLYANGNNDLDTNIYKEFLMIKEANLPRNTHVAVQIAGLPKNEKANVHDRSGACRYKIVDHEAILMENMGQVSMAEPCTYLDFLLWGSSQFPSERLMVIISGHGGYFIGLLADAVGEHVHAMGLKKFAEMLSLFRKISGKVIDMLVCNVCHMNMAEVMYELAMTSERAVKYVLLAQKNPPPDGLPLVLIINSLEADISGTELTEETAGKIVISANKAAIDNGLFAVCLDEVFFCRLKLLIDQLAGFILGNHMVPQGRSFGACIQRCDSDLISIPYLLNQIKKINCDVDVLEKQLTEVLQHIVLCPETGLHHKNYDGGLNLFFPSNQKYYFLTRQYYDNLLFSYENRWIHILSGNA